MRSVWTVVALVVLIALSATAISARVDSQLVLVRYQGWEQLERLAAAGLQIIN